jgi:hypothetical protein
MPKVGAVAYIFSLEDISVGCREKMED